MLFYWLPIASKLLLPLMAFEFHQDKDRYFAMQRENAAAYLIPFIQKYVSVRAGHHVLEVGCAEGGVLKAFLDLGCTGVGVELLPTRLRLAEAYLADEVAAGSVSLIARNIYDIDPQKDFEQLFDFIVLKDVIEHIPDQRRLLAKLRTLLRPGGHIFFGFPPWQMPFGGHQQICRHGLLAKLPYYHLLPVPVYKKILEIGGEKEHTIQELLEIKETGISIGQFEKIAKATNFNILGKQLYLINPIYRYKFGLNERKQIKWLGDVPYLRNFVTTCAYYLLEK
jgi:SAM-dependent methyltransferase